MKDKILLERHYVLIEPFPRHVDKEACEYYNAYLLINFGIRISNPEYVNAEALRQLSKIFDLDVPLPFYSNPQDTRFFTCEELLIEQVVSYIFGYGTDLGRVEIFQKTFSQYVIGNDYRFRTYELVNKTKADKILVDVVNAFCAYKRPFSSEEKEQFLFLVKEGYYDFKTPIECKDNIFILLKDYPELAVNLDKKDVVKYSIDRVGEYKNYHTFLSADKELQELFKIVIPQVRDCPLSKKQAKYFSRIIKCLGLDYKEQSNEKSPYRLAKACLDKGDVLGAAKVYAKNGSLFMRNIKMLAARCNEEQLTELLAMIPSSNPTVLYQLLTSLDFDVQGIPRTFKFYGKNMSKSHTETEYETAWRKSALSDELKKKISDSLINKLKEYYSSLPKLGKIYISDDFKNVALPVNTSASGNGIDVLPCGSRIKFEAKYLRTFCYWQDVRDIDASTVILTKDMILKNEYDVYKHNLSWRTYHTKLYGDDALSSGDCTDVKGSEYQDIHVDGLVKKGYKYAICCINGYGNDFSYGTIKAGVQIKTNIETAAWDPKNIEFEMNIKGECRSFTNFAIDLERKEIIIVNIKSNTGVVVTEGQVEVARAFLSEHYLDFNMKSLLSCLGEEVTTPEEASYVFDNEYQAQKGQKVIRAFDIPSLVTFVNMKKSA